MNGEIFHVEWLLLLLLLLAVAFVVAVMMVMMMVFIILQFYLIFVVVVVILVLWVGRWGGSGTRLLKHIFSIYTGAFQRSVLASS